MSRRRRIANDSSDVMGCMIWLGGLYIAAELLMLTGVIIEHTPSDTLVQLALAGADIFLVVRFRRRVWRGAVGLIRRWRGGALLRRGPGLATILSLSSYGFELFCRDLLEREGFSAVATRPTNDEGVDVELRSRDGSFGLAQCKRWQHTKVGRPTLQQLYGQMIHRGATFGYVITTSGFTREAREWAKTKQIRLVDGDALTIMAARR